MKGIWRWGARSDGEFLVKYEGDLALGSPFGRRIPTCIFLISVPNAYQLQGFRKSVGTLISRARLSGLEPAGWVRHAYFAGTLISRARIFGHLFAEKIAGKCRLGSLRHFGAPPPW